MFINKWNAQHQLPSKLLFTIVILSLPAFLIRVVCEHEVRLRLHQVPQRPDTAPAHGVEDSETAVGFAVEGCGEHAEVAAGGALLAEEGLAGVEFETSFGAVFGFAEGVGWKGVRVEVGWFGVRVFVREERERGRG